MYHEKQSPHRHPTRKNILEAMEWLVSDCKVCTAPLFKCASQVLSDAVQQAGDVLWFHYSGHGSQQPPPANDEDEKKMADTIVPVDFQCALLHSRLVSSRSSARNFAGRMACWWTSTFTERW